MVRDETQDEQADRKWTDLLQELRVMQTGVQLLAGFLLTLPFQDRFADLDDVQRTAYLVLVTVAGITTALVLAPVAVHRRLAGRHVKPRVVEMAHRATRPDLRRCRAAHHRQHGVRVRRRARQARRHHFRRAR